MNPEIGISVPSSNRVKEPGKVAGKYLRLRKVGPFAALAVATTLIFGACDSGPGGDPTKITAQILPTSSIGGAVAEVTPTPEPAPQCKDFPYQTSYGSYASDPTLSWMNNNPDMRGYRVSGSQAMITDTNVLKDNSIINITVKVCPIDPS